MNEKTIPLIKTTSFFLIVLFLFSFSISSAFSASDPGLVQTGCTSWDLTADVGSWTNPGSLLHPDSCGNPDVWQFMISTGLTQDPQTYSIASYFTSNYAGVNMWAWTKTEGALWPMIRYNASDTTYWGISLPHTVELHPENNQLAIIAWKSPVSGYVSITGSIVDAHTAGGDGIKWFIDKNSSNLAYGSYGDGGSQDFANGTNGSNLNTIAVNTNDMLYLIVHPNGNDSADTTRVNLTINATNQSTNTPSPYTSWDLNSAVGSWTTFENPHPDSWGNPDVWQFMISTGLTQDPATYSIASYFTSSYYNQPNVYAWTKTEGALWPMIRYNATDTTLWGISLPHIVEIHPENNQLAIIAWKSPVSGYVSITGSVADAHAAGGDGIKWFIDKNSSNLAYGSYGDGGSQDFANGTNGSNLSSIAVNTNDMLYLIVHPNGNDSADTTRVNLVINAINVFTPTPTATLTPMPTLTSTPTITFTITPTSTLKITPIPTDLNNCMGGMDFEIQGVTGNNGADDYYGVKGFARVWDAPVTPFSSYVNSVWLISDTLNIVEIGWRKAGGADDFKYFRTWTYQGIYHEDFWGTPAIDTDHEFKVYNDGAEGWQFYVDNIQRTPNVSIERFAGDAGAMRERHNNCDGGWAHLWNLQKYDSNGNWTVWETIDERNYDSPWYLDALSASEFFVTSP